MFGVDDAIIGGLAAGGISAIGTIIGGNNANNTNRDIAQQASAFNAEQAQKQMDFQKEMRSTQYQTAVEDLQKAGLNPMLAYTQGGAGTPSGAAGQAVTTRVESPIPHAIQSAVGAASIKADLTNKEAETTKILSEVGVNDEQRKYLDAQTNLAILEMPNVSQKLKNMISEQMLNEARKTSTNADEAARRLDTVIRKQGDLPEAQSKGTYYKNSPYNPFTLKDVIAGGHSAADLARSLNPLKLGK